MEFWQGHGALEILGLPVSQPFVDDRGLIVQYYERAIMEYHPENRPEFRVLLTLPGAERLGARPERNAPPMACDPPSCSFFEPTRHTLRGSFLAYWTAAGGLPVFGFPLTEEFVEVNPADGKPYRVQYFERNRFEYHPENAGGRFEVLLGLLGAETLRGRPEVLRRPPAIVPESGLNAAGMPVRLAIPTLGVDAPVLPVGVDEQGNMASPETAFDTTWYAPGTRPGERGNAAVSGHVDFRDVGQAVFWDLQRLGTGDEVWVTDDKGARRRFVVQSVETYQQIPLDRVFGFTGDRNLNLISCIGDFDPVSRQYDRRIVVYTQWDGVVR